MTKKKATPNAMAVAAFAISEGARDPGNAPEHIRDILLRYAERDPKGLAGLVAEAKKTPDALDRLLSVLREDRPESRRLLSRVIRAVGEDPGFSELAAALSLWQTLPFVDVLIREPSSGGRSKKGPLPLFADRLERARIEERRLILVKWGPLVAHLETKSEILRFITAEWKAKRFPYTLEDGLARIPGPPEKREKVPPLDWGKLLPLFAKHLERIGAEKSAAFDRVGGERTARPAYQKRATALYLEEQGRPTADAERVLDRLKKLPRK